MPACLAQSRVHSQALHVVRHPEAYAACPGLRLLAWAALMAARGCRVDQARLGRIARDPAHDAVVRAWRAA